MTTRRTMLAVLGGAATAALGCSDEGGGGADAGTTRVDVGAVTDYPTEGITLRIDEHLLVARDGRGFYAMSATCLHQRCELRPAEGDVCAAAEGNLTRPIGPLCCHCHGSTYDPDGRPLSGPAAMTGGTLAHYEVVLERERVVVLVGPRVAADRRTSAT